MWCIRIMLSLTALQRSQSNRTSTGRTFINLGWQKGNFTWTWWRQYADVWPCMRLDRRSVKREQPQTRCLSQRSWTKCRAVLFWHWWVSNSKSYKALQMKQLLMWRSVQNESSQSLETILPVWDEMCPCWGKNLVYKHGGMLIFQTDLRNGPFCKMEPKLGFKGWKNFLVRTQRSIGDMKTFNWPSRGLSHGK